MILCDRGKAVSSPRPPNTQRSPWLRGLGVVPNALLLLRSQILLLFVKLFELRVADGERNVASAPGHECRIKKRMVPQVLAIRIWRTGTAGRLESSNAASTFRSSASVKSPPCGRASKPRNHSELKPTRIPFFLNSRRAFKTS